MMNNLILKELETQIENLLEDLSNEKAGTDEYNAISNAVKELYATLNKEKELYLNERKIELETMKYENDRELKIRQLEIDALKNADNKIDNQEQREFQAKENSKDRDIQLKTLSDSKIWNGVKTGVEIAGLVVPIVFYGMWMKRGLEFEKEGSYTSTTFKGLISKFKV